MASIYNEVYDEMRSRGLDIGDFEQVLSYLLSAGVINREDSQKEERLYDLFLRMEDMAKDYLSLVGIKTMHDEDLQSIRLYAPNSETPDLCDDAFEEHRNSNLSGKLNTEESAYLIALALYYDQKLREEKITDAEMVVELNQEEFAIALATFIGYTASPSRAIRDEALRTLKRLRVVTFGKELFTDGDNPLIIRPHIVNLLPKETLRAYIKELEGAAV